MKKGWSVERRRRRRGDGMMGGNYRLDVEDRVGAW
jgi:hypothetical protein